jgi:hypothetical protein
MDETDIELITSLEEAIEVLLEMNKEIEELKSRVEYLEGL